MEGDLVNLTVVNNHSTSHHWYRIHAPLHDGYVIKDYTIGGTNYSSLTFTNASYSDDGGKYVFSASNDCGHSNVSVQLDIKKPGMCACMCVCVCVCGMCMRACVCVFPGAGLANQQKGYLLLISYSASRG